MRKHLIVFLLCWPALASAQTPVPATGTGFSLVWNHDGVDVTSWILVANDMRTDVTAQVTPRAGVDGCGALAPSPCFGIPFPALSTGRHDLVLCAANIAGEACSLPFAVVSVNPPTAAPSGVRAVPSSPTP